jgi:hypothetical protein
MVSVEASQGQAKQSAQAYTAVTCLVRQVEQQGGCAPAGKLLCCHPDMHLFQVRSMGQVLLPKPASKPDSHGIQELNGVAADRNAGCEHAV